MSILFEPLNNVLVLELLPAWYRFLPVYQSQRNLVTKSSAVILFSILNKTLVGYADPVHVLDNQNKWVSGRPKMFWLKLKQ